MSLEPRGLSMSSNSGTVWPTGMALNYILQNNFKADVGMRPDSRKIGVLITDGKSQDEIVFTSQNLRDSGIELYAIGESIRVTKLTQYKSQVHVSAGDLEKVAL